MKITDLRGTKITSLDIRNHKFPKKMRGYHRDEVDAYQQHIAKEVDDLIRENNELAEKCSELDRHRRNIQELEVLLTQCLRATSELHEKTKIKAEELLEESRVAAEQRLEQAIKDSARLRNDAREDAQRIRERISFLDATRQRSIYTLVEFLRTQFRLVGQEAECLGFDLTQATDASSEKIVPVILKEEVKGA